MFLAHDDVQQSLQDPHCARAAINALHRQRKRQSCRLLPRATYCAPPLAFVALTLGFF
jgi:hypothetical protein